MPASTSRTDRPASRPVPPAPPSAAQPAVWKTTLKITEDSREAWSVLLGRPDFARRKMAVSLGFEDQSPLDSDSAATLDFKVLPTVWVAVWGGKSEDRAEAYYLGVKVAH